MTTVYRVQCKTFQVARDIVGDYRTVTTYPAEAQAPPFCLRIVRGQRTQAQQDFRDVVAGEVRRARRMGVM